MNLTDSRRGKRKFISDVEDQNSDGISVQSFENGDHKYDSDRDSFYIETFAERKKNLKSNEPDDGTPTEPKNKKPEKRGYKRPDYKFLIGKARIVTDRIATKCGCIDNELMWDNIDALSTGTFKCSCPLGFYGSIRANKGGSYVLYAACAIVSHKARFRFDVFEVDENIIEINFSSTHEVPFKHDENDVKPFTEIRGRHRTAMKKLLRYCSARKLQLDTINECDTELLADIPKRLWT